MGLLNTALYDEKVSPLGYRSKPLCFINNDGLLTDEKATYRSGYNVININIIIIKLLSPSNANSPTLFLILFPVVLADLVDRVDLIELVDIINLHASYHKLASLAILLILLALISNIKLTTELNNPTAVL